MAASTDPFPAEALAENRRGRAVPVGAIAVTLLVLSGAAGLMDAVRESIVEPADSTDGTAAGGLARELPAA